MKRLAKWGSIFLIIMTFSCSADAETKYVSQEPPLTTLVVWDVQANGLLSVGYDLNGNGRPDFFTLRVVETSFFSKDTLQQTVAANPGKPVFYVRYSTSTFYYIADASPVYFVTDPDEDGNWDFIYRNVPECNGMTDIKQFKSNCVTYSAEAK